MDAMQKAIEDLRGWDHCLISEEGAIKLAKPFGIVPRCHTYYANPRDPKGLTLNDGADSAVGIAAETLACQICDGLGVKYRQCLGRGFQLRACCDALSQHFTMFSPV